MNYKIYIILFITLCFQTAFSQKTIDKKYEKARELFTAENYLEADSLIKEVKRPYKTVPPKIAYLEILIKDKLIKSEVETAFTLLDETKKLVANYKSKFIKYQNDNYKEVVKIGDELNKYPKDLASFNTIKEQKQKELALEKEQLLKKALELKQKEEADRIKKIEEDRINRIVTDRKNKLRPYTNPAMFSEYELARLSENEFNEQLNKVIQESIKIQADEKKIKDIKEARLVKLDTYRTYVSYENLVNLGIYTDNEFEKIYQKAKADFKATEKRNKPQLGTFSSIGFQSGEIAKYGLMYESGGKKFIGFHIAARSSVTPEKDIESGMVVKNRNEIDLGPSFKIFKRIYLNIGAGYGYYNFMNVDFYANTAKLDRMEYFVATSGLMIRINRIINLNGGVSFMDIDKDIYKPDIIFGLTFNLKGKN